MRSKKKPRKGAKSANIFPVLIGNTHHMGARESQQDSFRISDVSNPLLYERKGVFAVVADGMGGMEDGAEISNVATRSMLQYFNEVEFSGNFGLDLLNMLFVANENVCRFMEGRSGKGGSTAVAAVIHHGRLYWSSVGDSRVYLCRSGACIQLNREHVYGAELDAKAAAGDISWTESACDPGRGALTAYLGMGKLELTDYSARPVQLVTGDRILLMSDGVFGALSDEEISSAMSEETQKSAEILQQKIFEKRLPAQDNFTAVILTYM
jgi:protein phosphatase